MTMQLKLLMVVVCGWSICFEPLNVYSDETQTQKRSPKSKSMFDEWDRNKDGFLSPQELPSTIPRSVFGRVDRNGDGKISRQEDEMFRQRNRQRRGQPERSGNQIPKGVVVKRDVVYATVGERKLHLDLYLQAQRKEPCPLIIWIHGGGWKSGTKQNPRHALSLLKHGFAVASVEYRLSGEAVFPAAIEDCKAAVSFLRLYANSYGLDPQRFAAWGSSAGGHLVALLGTTNDVEVFNTHAICRKAAPTVQAVCNWYGPTDFLRMNDFPGRIDHDAADSPESLFIGGPIQERRELVGQANPIRYVSSGDPPMLLMHGDADQLVPYNQSELLHAALVKCEVPSTLYRVKRGGHGFRGSAETPQKLQQRVLVFLQNTLNTPR